MMLLLLDYAQMKKTSDSKVTDMDNIQVAHD